MHLFLLLIDKSATTNLHHHQNEASDYLVREKFQFCFICHEDI